jgi:signal transduction histidine kinase
VDLADVARHVIAESAAAAERVGVELRSDLKPAPVTGDAVLLERLIQNLVDNGIRYNIGEDGWVMVRTSVVDDLAQLTAENTGAVVPPYAVPSLFEPFRRQSSAELMKPGWWWSASSREVLPASLPDHGRRLEA